jgi:hypothetical protein
MLTKVEYEKILHDIKRAAKVLTFVRDEKDHEKRQTLIGLMIDELDRLAEDVEECKEKNEPGAEQKV